MRCKDCGVIAIKSCISDIIFVIFVIKDDVCGTEEVDGRVVGFIWRRNISVIQGYRGEHFLRIFALVVAFLPQDLPLML